jgi:hypothetical protein
MITLEGGNIQNAGGIGIPNGSITLQLNVDATIIATPFGLWPQRDLSRFSSTRRETWFNPLRFGRTRN